METVYKQSFKREDASNLELSVYNAGLQKCEGGHTWGPGIRDHYLVHLVIAGKGSYTVNGKQYDGIGPGDMFLARPSQLISYTANQVQPWEYYWVGFNGTSAGRYVQLSPFVEDCPVFHCAEAERAKALIHNIFLAQGPKPSDEITMTGNLYLFLALLAELRQQSGESRPDTSAQYVIDAVKYIQFNYSHNIGVDDIAKAVGISRSHLYRVFLKNVGQSPIDYLTAFRIGEACSLLENTNLSIAEVAFSTGFFDQFYFSRVFKKLKGVAPSRYLKSVQTGEQDATT